MVVDDDKVTNDLICEFLIMKGFAVDPAFNGLEASQKFNPARHDLVITDLAMPLMNGWELIALLHSRAPALPIILITAYWADCRPSEEPREGVSAILNKPVNLSQLASAVAKLLPTAAAAS
jgi:CheY-like chemotaxis protein